MNKCSRRHDRVYYESKLCPVCRVIQVTGEVIRGLEQQVEDLEEQAEALRGELEKEETK